MRKPITIGSYLLIALNLLFVAAAISLIVLVTTKGVGHGTGLGLATVFGIVKQHKGHITCCSQLGQGTTFKIYLPAIEKKLEGGVQESRTPIVGGTETILLVDDEEHLRDLGSTILKRYGYEVLTAETGREALEAYMRERQKYL